MIDLSRIFANFYDSKEISDSELLDFGEAHVKCMETNNPDGILTPLIIPTKLALAAFEAGGSASLNTLGVQKSRTMTKDEFCDDLPEAMSKIYGALIAVYGANGPEVVECLPEGRRAIHSCKNDDRKKKLQALVTALTSKVPPLAPGVLTQATNLLDTWTLIYGAQGTAKGAKKGSANAINPLRTALELELTKNVLTIALHFLCDKSKVALYFPQELLRNRANAVTPGPSTLTLVQFNPANRQADFTITAENAASFRVLRRMEGEADFSMVAEEIKPVDGVAYYSLGLGTAGNFEFVAEAVNGSRVGERSGIVRVPQP